MSFLEPLIEAFEAAVDAVGSIVESALNAFSGNGRDKG